MITIVDSPYSPTPVGQKLIVVASSDNVANTGFKFKVVVNDGFTTSTFYVSPNPNNRLVVDIAPYIKLTNAVRINGVVVHALTDQDGDPAGEGYVQSITSVSEAWLVAGVLTDDPDGDGDVDLTRFIWNATFQASDGYKPNPATRYALNGSTDRWLSDRLWNTSKAVGGISAATSKVFIACRESDYGVLSIINGISGDTATKAVVSIYDSGGTPHSFTITFDADIVLHLPVYPANLNASATVGWLKPLTYPGWLYIKVQAQTSGSAQASVDYYLYNTAVYGPTDCRHDNVRLGWKNFSGGWDYFNFIKKNEESINVQRKRFIRVLGNYGDVSNSVAFNFYPTDAGLMENNPIVEQFIDINSDWLTEGEFLFLKSLIVSKQVHLIQDTGVALPVVIENNDYRMPRERNSKQKQLSLRLKYANDLWT